MKFDLIVIGAGSGLEVSSAAAERGLSVAVVESGPFGGTCLNRGCIPSKMLIHCADVVETINNASKFGVKAKVEAIDWRFIISRAFDTIDQDAANVERGNREAPNITVFKGEAAFTGRKTLRVNDDEISSDTIVIAAGTRPFIPAIPGLERVRFFTSDQALRLQEQPRRMAIMGGGYIAAELAHFFGTLGTEVTIIHRRETLLRVEDDDVAQRFTDIYRRKFKMLTSSHVSSVNQDRDEVRIEVESAAGTQTLTVDALLVATGRVPNTDTLSVATSGVKTTDQGFVKTDRYLQSNIRGIWALGDIVGKNFLKHNANLEAAYVAHNIFNSESMQPVDYRAIPHAVFASPQVGAVGITEQAAKAQGKKYVAATYAYADTAYGASIEDKDGFVKVLADPKTREILGCHIIGTDAATLVQEAANAMRRRATVDAITQSIYVHPALPEVVQRAFGALGI